MKQAYPPRFKGIQDKASLSAAIEDYPGQNKVIHGKFSIIHGKTTLSMAIQGYPGQNNIIHEKTRVSVEI